LNYSLREEAWFHKKKETIRKKKTWAVNSRTKKGLLRPARRREKEILIRWQRRRQEKVKTGQEKTREVSKNAPTTTWGEGTPWTVRAKEKKGTERENHRLARKDGLGMEFQSLELHY